MSRKTEHTVIHWPENIREECEELERVIARESLHGFINGLAAGAALATAIMGVVFVK